MTEDLNPGDCVRCHRKQLPARTRGGLCWWCAKEDPTLPGWTVSLGGVQSREDLVDLRNMVKRVTRGKGGRPQELSWERVCEAYARLQAQAEDGRGPTQAKVAEYLNFDEGTVRARENGGWPPRP